MIPIPIAKYLHRMARDDQSVKSGAAPQSILLKPRHQKQPPCVEDMISEAYDRGMKQGYASAASERAVESELEKAVGEQLEISELRAIHARAHEALAEKLRSGLLEIEERVSAAAARILAPYVRVECAKTVAQALSESLKAMFGPDAPRLIKVSGPAEELEALKQRMAEFPVEVRYLIEGGADVTIQMDDTTIRTQLGKWIAALDAAVA